MENLKNKITLKQILWYFIIFSVIGLIIETLFCYITTGVLESRKGLIWGPFCPVYGVGATILILLLEQYKDNILKLFLAGAIIGNIIEYGLSYILEAIYGIRFWDYGYLDLNINGRICTKYSIFWGILAVILVKTITPIINKIISKIPEGKKLNTTIITLIVIDTLATVWAIKAYQNRVIEDYYNIENNEKNGILYKIEETLFSNKKMKNTFPNLRYMDANKNEYYIKDMIKDN